MDDSRIHLSGETEDAQWQTPWESVFFAYAGVAPIAVGAIAFFLVRRDTANFVAHATILWAAAILCFLAGVRRGLSFRQEGGPLLTQLATMLWLFGLGFASLVSPSTLASLVLLIIGFATTLIYDPVAAHRHEAPRFFQRLRPVQMLVPVVSLALILAGLLA